MDSRRAACLAIEFSSRCVPHDPLAFGARTLFGDLAAGLPLGSVGEGVATIRSRRASSMIDAETIGMVKGVADKPMQTFKQRIRQLTRRSGGRSMAQVVQRLRLYMLGWKAYFGLSQTPKVWRTLDEWLRHRLRAIQLKHWKRGKTIFREPRALGAGVDVAAQVAGNAKRWWHNSAMLLNLVLPIAYFDAQGVPRLS